MVGKDLIMATLLGSGGGSSGSGGGGVRLVQGSVTMANKGYKLQLFETDTAPDYLYITYTPEKNNTNPSTNSVFACLAHNLGDNTHDYYDCAYVNGTTFVPTRGKAKNNTQVISDGWLVYPWIDSVMQFAAAQTFFYTAIYMDKGVQ